jgi:hypothetical protein
LSFFGFFLFLLSLFTFLFGKLEKGEALLLFDFNMVVLDHKLAETLVTTMNLTRMLKAFTEQIPDFSCEEEEKAEDDVSSRVKGTCLDK